jgi:putative FmdB family regulatory protein
MPLVDVECQECGKTSELLVRSGDQLLCPSCGSQRVEKQLGAPSIGRSNGLPVASMNPSSSLPPCRPGCCRIPTGNL